MFAAHTRHIKHGSPAPLHIALVLSTLSLTIFPPLFFFSFLYYTDVGATFLILLSYALSTCHHHIPSAGVSQSILILLEPFLPYNHNVLSMQLDTCTQLFRFVNFLYHLPSLCVQVLLLAICFRQTCVVWVVFTAGTVGLKIIEPNFNLDKKGKHIRVNYTLLSTCIPSESSILL